MRIISPTGRKLSFNNKKVEYDSEFLFLNNFDNISNGISISEIGPNVEFLDTIFRIENSNVFSNKNCLKIYGYNSNYNISSARTINTIKLLENEIYTFETYFSNYGGGYTSSSYSEVTLDGNSFAFECDYSNNSYRIQISYNIQNDYTLYNSARYVTDANHCNYIFLPISLSTPIHVAAVLKNGYVYVFGNGVLYIKSSCRTNATSTSIRFVRENYPTYIGINFISLRKGDFSNNLQSFTVPTKKYSL